VKNEYIYAVAEDSIYPVFKAAEVGGQDKSRLEVLWFVGLWNQCLKTEAGKVYQLFDVT